MTQKTPYAPVHPSGRGHNRLVFCLIDDAYANLNPRGRRYESLKRLSNSGDITLTLFQQLRGIESGRDLGGDACLGQYLAGGVSKGRPGGGGLEHALIELLTDLLRSRVSSSSA